MSFDISSFFLGLGFGLIFVSLFYILRISKALEEFLDKHSPSRIKED